MNLNRQVAALLCVLLWSWSSSSSAVQTVCDDNGGAGYALGPDQGSTVNVTLDITGADVGYIVDVNASTDVSHTYTGDLRATLTSPANTAVKLYDRPGNAVDDSFGAPYGCNRADIDASFDDESSNAPIESQPCTGGAPVFNGDYQAHPTPAGNALSNFDGEDPIGSWIMTLVDSADGDGGRVNEVCVAVSFAALEFEKYASTDTNCSDQLDTLTVPGGTNVYYCYTATNVGDERFVVNTGNAVDDQGIDISGLEGSYIVNQSRTVVQGPYVAGGAQIPVGTTVNTATVIATGDTGNFPNTQTITTVESATVNVTLSDFSTSTKSAVDLNGGDANPGDTLRYTITIIESAGIAGNGVSVTDTIDPLLTGFNVVSIPSGAADTSTPGTGPLNVSNIDVAAGGSATIVFDAIITGTANPGDAINNTATINNPADGSNTNATAPAVIVSASSLPSSGIKNLYTYFDTNSLSRIVPASDTGTGNINDNGGSVALQMTPATQGALELGNGSIQVPLCLDRQGNFGFLGRNVTVTLDYIAAGPGGSSGAIGNQTQNGILTADGYQLVTFSINLPSDLSLNANTALRLTITNDSPAFGNQQIRVSSTSCGTPSRVQLNANTVINVDSVDAYDAVYPGGAIQPVYTPNTTVFIRSVVSDPFGSFDINGANIEIIDALGNTVQASTPMTLVNDSGVATRTYEYQYTIPGVVAEGNWTARVIANEGTEGTVSDLGVGTFVVGSPSISILKLVSTISDPVNAGSNPKAIPGAIVEFQITASNSGVGPADSGSVIITDPISSNLQLYLGNPANPVQFTDGSPTSGLGFTFIDLANTTDDIDFSNDGGSTFVTPVADGNGFDITVPPINYIRITPDGPFNGSTGSGDPSFTLRFRARVR